MTWPYFSNLRNCPAPVARSVHTELLRSTAATEDCCCSAAAAATEVMGGTGSGLPELNCSVVVSALASP